MNEKINRGKLVRKHIGEGIATNIPMRGYWQYGNEEEQIAWVI